MGGGGEYERKYGGSEIEVPWFRKSTYPWIRDKRDMAQRSHKLRQQCLGAVQSLDPVTYNLDLSQIESAITSRTRASVQVHLYGQCAGIDTIFRRRRDMGWQW